MIYQSLLLCYKCDIYNISLRAQYVVIVEASGRLPARQKNSIYCIIFKSAKKILYVVKIITVMIRIHGLEHRKLSHILYSYKKENYRIEELIFNPGFQRGFYFIEKEMMKCI